MKYVVFLILCLLFCSFSSADTEPLHLTFAFILALCLGIYEVVSRLIPTSKTMSIIGKFLEILTWLSNLFDRKKRK